MPRYNAEVIRPLIRYTIIALCAASLLASTVAASLAIRGAFGDVSPVRITRAGDYELATSGGRLWLLRRGSQVTHSLGPSLVLVSIVLAVPAAICLTTLRRRRQERLAGVCRRCGYDLRATPERCPECGQAPTMRGAT
jgi:hypothetical protein